MRPSIKAAKELFGNKPIKFVEVGVAEGTHAKELIHNEIGLYFRELVLTDIWENISSNIPYNGNFPEYLRSLRAYFSVYPNVKFCKGYSIEVAKQFPDEYFDMVYIDAGHEYEDVVADINAWYPKVKKGGILAGHDYMNTNPNYKGLDKAINELPYSVNSLKADNKDYTNSDWWVFKQ